MSALDSGLVAERLLQAARAIDAAERAGQLAISFADLLESEREALFLKNLDGVYLFVNGTGARLFGRQPEQVFGRDDRALLPAADAAQVRDADRSLVARGRVVTAREVLAYDGEEREWVCTRGPFFDAEGHVVGVFTVARPVAVTGGGRSVAPQEAELIRAVRARDEFFSIAAHELKTPIAALQLLVESTAHRALGQGSIEERLAQMLLKLGQAQQQASKLTRLVDHLLDVSRIGAGRLELQRDRVELVDVVRGTIELHRLELDQAGCPVLLEAPAELWGYWDALRLEQLFGNLLMNAVKYAPHEPISVRLGEEEGCAVLAVEDHGPGIRLEDQARIFERFERGNGETRRSVKGYGLGLWIVRQIVEAHGGALSLQSQLGEGATFTVVLPCGRAAAPRQLAEAALAP